jgi:hypothetical protein
MRIIPLAIALQVNVAIRANVPGSGRGTFAPHDIKKGEGFLRHAGLPDRPSTS